MEPLVINIDRLYCNKHGWHRGCVQEFLDCIITHFKIADFVLPFRFNLDIWYYQMHCFKTVIDIDIKTHTFILILQLAHFQVTEFFLIMKYHVT